MNRTENRLRKRTSRVNMSFSSLSSALGISSLSVSDHNGIGGTHKRKESGIHGEVFVSSFDTGSVDGSSISSDGVKSNLQEASLPALLGEHDSATATGSSSGFLSLAVSGSSLSSDRSGPHLAITVSRVSDALRELTEGIQEVQKDEDTSLPHGGDVNDQVDEPPQQVVLLENVEYVTSLPHASSCTDLSTMDEPITKETAKGIFSRRIVPSEIVPADNPSDISTLYGGTHLSVDYEDDADVDVMEKDEETEVDIEKGQTETVAMVVAPEVQVSFPCYQRYLGHRSRTEVFFMFVIGISCTVLIVLLVIVFR